MDGIIAGVSPIAPIAHEAWDGEIEGFERLNGYRPVDVRIARIGFVGLGRTAPPGVYVHAGNPLRPLTIDEVGRILTTGLLPSDVRRWSQLGVGGDLAAHAIHVYGTRDDGREITTLRSSRFGGRPFVRHYEALPDDAAVLQAVAGDRYGIGLVWSADPRRVPADVRRLPLAAAGQPASIGEYADVRAGRYPLARYLHVYLNRAPGAVLDPLAQEYLRLALSADGQRLVESLKDTAQGFVPLTAGELLSETAKLETGPR